VLKKERLVCKACEKVQRNVIGHHCRFCGSSRLGRSLDHARPGAIKPWDQMSKKGHGEASQFTVNMVAFMQREKMTWPQFTKLYNTTASRKRNDLKVLAPETFGRWAHGERKPDREESILIARIVKLRQYLVYECPFFHPHAAMRVYPIQYHEYWKRNRKWFYNNPGKDPGDWWESFRPTAEENDRRI